MTRASSPNFITTRSISGEIINLQILESKEYYKVNGKIVFIDKADPGFDWIFSKEILGLITIYGGVASHMAIRCSEFEIPAAIGCGELLGEQIKNASIVKLDCNNKLLTIL